LKQTPLLSGVEDRSLSVFKTVIFSPYLQETYLRSLMPFVCAAKLDGVKTYMRMRRVPNHLQVKVIKWFDYLWLTQKCSDEEKAVSCLPGEQCTV
jgi:hypothetical protein